MLKQITIRASKIGWGSRSCVGCAVVIASCLTTLHPGASAAQRSASIAVSTQVKAITTISTVSQPTSFVVTQNDIKVGYVDLPAAGSYAIVNNDRAGYSLTFQTLDFSKSLSVVRIVSGLAAPVTLLPAVSNNAPQPYSAFKTTLNLTMRFTLQLKKDSKGNVVLKPGSYPWPIVTVAVQPL